MKIKKENQFGLLCTKDSLHYLEIYTNIVSPVKFGSEAYSTIREPEGAIYRLEKIFDEKDNGYYLITKTVQEMAEKIKLPKPYDARIFQNTPRKKRTLLINEREFFRYAFDDEGGIICIHVLMDWDTLYLEYRLFRLDLKTGDVITNDEATMVESIDKFMKILTFMDLAEVELIILNANQKHGTKKSNPIKNDTDKKIIIVDSNWNKYVIRLEGFGVSGHFRFQPFGEGLAFRKWIWINSYEKSGYIRKPKIDNE